MDLLSQIKQKAQSNLMRIVLPETEDERTLKAAAQILEEKLTDLILIGNPDKVNSFAADLGVSIEGATIVDPANHPKKEAYAKLLFDLRKHKGLTEDDAAKWVENPLYLATLMIKAGDADGEVAGAANSTANVLKPALQIVKTAPGYSVVSGAFVMIMPDKVWGDDGVMVFADCAVTPDPDAQQLGQIAVATAKTAQAVAGIEPRVAMLSFSTKGSGGKAPMIEKVVEATKVAQEMAPELKIDGELQADAAIVEKVGTKKAPGSPIAGSANVLVFPNLESGNISYKLVQRLAGATAIGPILQGMAAPINDLSRGCSVSDIVDLVAVTAVQASAK